MVVSELLYGTFLGLTLALFIFVRDLNPIGYLLAPVPLVVPCVFILLHVFVGFLQAFVLDRKSTRLNSSHANISYAVFCLKKKKKDYNLDVLVRPILQHEA